VTLAPPYEVTLSPEEAPDVVIDEANLLEHNYSSYFKSVYFEAL
jgi:hypothetical protein